MEGFVQKKIVFAPCLVVFGVVIPILYTSNILVFLNIRSISEITIFENDMALRRNIMKTACKAHGLDVRGKDLLHQPKSSNYIIANLNNTNLVWCPVFKSGSSR